jgi:hypothetical protein
VIHSMYGRADCNWKYYSPYKSCMITIRPRQVLLPTGILQQSFTFVRNRWRLRDDCHVFGGICLRECMC